MDEPQTLTPTTTRRPDMDMITESLDHAEGMWEMRREAFTAMQAATLRQLRADGVPEGVFYQPKCNACEPPCGDPGSTPLVTDDSKRYTILINPTEYLQVIRVLTPDEMTLLGLGPVGELFQASIAIFAPTDMVACAHGADRGDGHESCWTQLLTEGGMP